MKAPIVLTHLVPFLVVITAVASCRQSRDLNGVSEAKFVTVMAALQRVRDLPGLDSAKRAVSRDSILQSQGLTAAQLEAAAAKLAQSPARAQTVWQAIERRVNDTSAVSGTAAPKAK